ncbi:MAG: HAD-IA family hydrolase [Alphaproteobacteria bacterium]
MIRLVVFDCDGTLVDSQHVIVEAMRRSFAAKRLPPPEAEAVRRVVGLSLQTAIAALWPDGADDDVAALTHDYRKTFLALRAQPEHHEPLYPGAAEAIAALDDAGYLLGVATGKSRRGLSATLERFGLLERFVTLQTADDAPSKPHPGMLERAMAEAGAGTRETVLVGDTTFDVEMAVNAGVAALGVGWGYHETGALHAAGAQAIVESFAELGDAIAALGRP